MGLVEKLRSAFGGEGSETDTREPSHRCRDCGEEYFSQVSTRIDECHTCGGVNVERVGGEESVSAA